MSNKTRNPNRPCAKCGRSDVSFGKNKNKSDGRQSWCKECMRVHSKNYYHVVQKPAAMKLRESWAQKRQLEQQAS